MAYRDDIANEARNTANDRLDVALDAALAEYASVEPRAGLEERILANLRAGDALVAHGTWWIWVFGAGLAAVVLVAGTLAWRTTTATVPRVAIHPPNARPVPAPPQQPIQVAHSAPQKKPAPRTLLQPLPRQEAVASNPKLDVFPSPLPLSEQERLLAIYVGQFPEHAALVAEARMADLRQEAEERRAIAAGERDQKQ